MTDERTRKPTHPGSVLREITFPSMKVNISQAAREMSVSRQSLHKILAGERAITPEMAVRLGKFCGNGPGLWLRMQVAHDLWAAERALCEEIKNIPTHQVPAYAMD
jgi:addiction module HigA family antidote